MCAASKTLTVAELETLRDGLIAAAYDAGRAIMAVYAGDFATTRKLDRSPVTAADVAAEKIILQALCRLAPDIPVVAEEQVAAEGLPKIDTGRFFLVDPLDGTKEFIARNGEFTVNIALVEQGRPTLGIVYLPALDEMYAGCAMGALRRRQGGPAEPIQARALPATGAVMTISRSHAARELVKAESFGETIAATLVAGSSLKFCRIAEGVADLYPRFGPTMEWDTAAGHAVLLAAGGTVSTLDGAPLVYGKSGFGNPHFIARGRR
ncbi:MAG: 3'(2'),5'-bisphosphate nucleotidase CysQ [Rhodospirillaceae bacterium]|nr:3'(2'),5'-bisphosphate nucleotidase CysQ [Rhodospirillaceae bacterium]